MYPLRRTAARTAARACSRQTASIPTSSLPHSIFTAHRQGLHSSSRNYRLPFNTRAFSTSPTTRHGHLDPPKPGEERKVTFIDKDGDIHTFEVADGDNLLDIAQAHDIEMEGACGGSCACSTCHVIVLTPDSTPAETGNPDAPIPSQDYYDLIEEPSDDENDMLDLAFGLTETSRLGCQIKMTKELDGLIVKMPSMTRNMQASDFNKK